MPRRLLRRLLATASLAAASLPSAPVAVAAPSPSASSATTRGSEPGRPQLPVTTFKLKNGLTVMVSEDHTVPLVGVELWYHVGSKDERAGRTGFAHLFEHLMFQGSAHVADDEHFRLVAEAGGACNATTNRDRTNFFEVLPSNFLERALYLEADRMGFLLETMTQAKLDNQRDVVRNERRQNYENRPYGIASKAIAEALYPPEHPYHHLTIGEHADLEAATLDDVKDFFRTWYTPDNASLAIVGDVKLTDAKRLVEKWFGPLASHAPPAAPKATPVTLAAEKPLRLEDRVSLERLYLVWPSPPLFQPGDAELDLLATVLTAKSGRLYQRLVHELEVAQGVEASQASGRLASEFEIVVTAKPGHTAAEMKKLVDEELAALTSSRPVTKEELDRAKNGWEASFVYGLEEVGGMGGRTGRLNSYLYALGRADGLGIDLARYLDATPDSVEAVARRVLGPGRVALTIAPAAGGTAPPSSAPAHRPAAATGAPPASSGAAPRRTP